MVLLFLAQSTKQMKLVWNYDLKFIFYFNMHSLWFKKKTKKKILKKYKKGKKETHDDTWSMESLKWLIAAHCFGKIGNEDWGGYIEK